MGPDLRTGASVRQVRETPDGYEIDFQSSDKPTETLQCRYLIMATPAAEAGRLLGSKIADIAGTIESASLVVLNLGFRRSHVGHPLG
jgi:protoporphyrinogen oxidase